MCFIYLNLTCGWTGSGNRKECSDCFRQKIMSCLRPAKLQNRIDFANMDMIYLWTKGFGNWGVSNYSFSSQLLGLILWESDVWLNTHKGTNYHYFFQTRYSLFHRQLGPDEVPVSRNMTVACRRLTQCNFTQNANITPQWMQTSLYWGRFLTTNESINQSRWLCGTSITSISCNTNIKCTVWQPLFLFLCSL